MPLSAAILRACDAAREELLRECAALSAKNPGASDRLWEPDETRMADDFIRKLGHKWKALAKHLNAAGYDDRTASGCRKRIMRLNEPNDPRKKTKRRNICTTCLGPKHNHLCPGSTWKDPDCKGCTPPAKRWYEHTCAATAWSRA